MRRVICVAAVAFISICAACQSTQQGQQRGPGPQSKNTNRPHQLGSICKAGQTSDLIQIPVDATTTVLTDPANYVIFACEGDQIVWSTANTTAKLKITVTIQGTHAKELFKSNDTTIVWDPNNPGSGPAYQTPVETVDKPQNHIFLHKYSIDVLDLGTGTHYTLDPHVIPMGKG